MENISFGPENVTEGLTHDTTVELGFMIFLGCISFPTFVVGLIGNGLVIFLTGCRMKATVNSIWFLNLAIADFIHILFSAIDIVFNLIEQNSGYLNYFLSITIPLNRCASIFILAVISLDRCLCTWMVVWAQNKRTVLKAKIICMIIWVLSITCIPLSFQFIDTLLVTYWFVLGFLIPFLVIVSSYIAIGVRIKRLKMEKKLKSYRLIITVILAFFICSFPYSVCKFCISTAINNEWTIPDQIWIPYIFSLYLFQLNSCLNPFLYVFTCDDFKKKLKQSLQLVLETAFAEDHLDLRDIEGRAGEENHN